MSEADRGYVPGQLNNTPSDFRKWKSPYDMSPEEIDVLQRRNLAPTWTSVFDLGTAQSPKNPLIINQPGRAFRITGLTTATKYDMTANTGIETAATSVFVGCYILNNSGNNQSLSDSAETLFVKHGSGYRGDFIALGLFWPAQSNNSFRLTLYRYDGVAWQSGDAST